MPPGRIRRVLLGSVLLLLVGVPLPAVDTDPPDAPRERLRQRGYELSGEQFLYAASAGDTPALAAFIDSRLDLNDRYADGRTPLMGAVEYADTPTVDFLLERGARLDQTDPDGETALFYAVRARRDLMVHHLLEAGANPTHENRRGETPGNVARRLGAGGIQALLAARVRLRAQAGRERPEQYRVEGGPRWMRGLSASREEKNLGLPDAPVEVVVYVDLQCPSCRKFSREVLPKLARRYVRPGVIHLRVRHFPLPIHDRALAAALAAECAARQDRFWRYEHALVHGRGLDRTSLLEYGRSAGVGEFERFRECVDSGALRREVLKERGVGIQAGVRATPTVIVGDTRVEGFHRFDQYRRLIEKRLQTNPSGAGSGDERPDTPNH